jgi:hypothetical protein
MGTKESVIQMTSQTLHDTPRPPLPKRSHRVPEGHCHPQINLPLVLDILTPLFHSCLLCHPRKRLVINPAEGSLGGETERTQPASRLPGSCQDSLLSEPDGTLRARKGDRFSTGQEESVPVWEGAMSLLWTELTVGLFLGRWSRRLAAGTPLSSVPGTDCWHIVCAQEAQRDVPSLGFRLRPAFWAGCYF